MGKIPKTYDGWEAWGFFFSSFIYLIKHPATYGLPLVMLIGGGTYNEIGHWTDITISVGNKEKGVSIDELSYAGNPFITLAQDKTRSRTWQSDNAIVIERTFYGFRDDRFRIHKVEGENKLLVYYHPTKVVRGWPISGDMFSPDHYQPGKE